VTRKRGRHLAHAIVAALLGASVLLRAGAALAWNASGHMQIALVAYAALPTEVATRLAALLRQHPRFEQDFAPQLPRELSSDAERDRWIFAHAAVWPDLVRDMPGLSHPTWHYVNLELRLLEGGLNTCREAKRAFARSGHTQASGPIPGGPETILDALPRLHQELQDPARSASERALSLSWLLHLVGDAHQPLHAVALFSERRFPSGDRGGNEILLRGRGSLHRVWDGLLGEEVSLAALDREVRALSLLPVAARGREPTRPPADFAAWIDESCALARSHAYVPALLSVVSAAPRGKTHRPAAAAEGTPAPVEPKPEVALVDAYVGAARLAARRRAAQAGARLVALLRPI
jgi:hypothetical protein